MTSSSVAKTGFRWIPLPSSCPFYIVEKSHIHTVHCLHIPPLCAYKTSISSVACGFRMYQAACSRTQSGALYKSGSGSVSGMIPFSSLHESWCESEAQNEWGRIFFGRAVGCMERVMIHVIYSKLMPAIHLPPPPHPPPLLCHVYTKICFSYPLHLKCSS